MILTIVKNEFDSDNELMEYCELWQHLLFLDGWIIKAKLANVEEMSKSTYVGENQVDPINKCALIKILREEYYPADALMRYCGEKILVHELLHCKYNLLTNSDTYEGAYLDLMQHTMLEEMSKTLIIARYNLPLDFFINNSDKERALNS